MKVLPQSCPENEAKKAWNCNDPAHFHPWWRTAAVAALRGVSPSKLAKTSLQLQRPLADERVCVRTCTRPATG